MTLVRRARVEDAGGIARAWARAWRLAYRGLVPDAVLDAIDVDERRRRWVERLAGGDRTFVVEEHGIAGYCRVVVPSEVATLFVLPERRHGGLGTALLTAGLDELRSHSVHATLWVNIDKPSRPRLLREVRLHPGRRRPHGREHEPRSDPPEG